MKKIYYHIFKIDGHNYLIGATENGLAFVGSRDSDLDELKRFYDCSITDDISIMEPYVEQITEYLLGKRTQFSFKVDVSGTKFQEEVWNALSKIPYGTVTDYSKIAESIGRPKASRAVGTAVGKNPLLMVIP